MTTSINELDKLLRFHAESGFKLSLFDNQELAAALLWRDIALERWEKVYSIFQDDRSDFYEFFAQYVFNEDADTQADLLHVMKEKLVKFYATEIEELIAENVRKFEEKIKQQDPRDEHYSA